MFELLGPRNPIQDTENKLVLERLRSAAQHNLFVLGHVRLVEGDHHRRSVRMGELEEATLVQHPNSRKSVPLHPRGKLRRVIHRAVVKGGRGTRLTPSVPPRPLLQPHGHGGEDRTCGNLDGLGEEALQFRCGHEQVPVHPSVRYGGKATGNLAPCGHSGHEDRIMLVAHSLNERRGIPVVGAYGRQSHALSVLYEMLLVPQALVGPWCIRCGVLKEEKLDRGVALHVVTLTQGLVVSAIDVSKVHCDALVVNLVRGVRELGESTLADLTPGDVEHHEAWAPLLSSLVEMAIERVWHE
mmetsp:Transcript_95113/g.268697  ORF Transcript_95113/g.268697 Transcript_95113/m.268697 type:complete len:298 (-) Transcript_95113:261-1154(-)